MSLRSPCPSKLTPPHRVTQKERDALQKRRELQSDLAFDRYGSAVLAGADADIIAELREEANRAYARASYVRKLDFGIAVE